MAFSDILLENSKQAPRVIMVDQHNNSARLVDNGMTTSYDFVQLHQPSSMCGIESKKLELSSDHRATRSELLTYYAHAQSELESKFDFEFVGDTTVDLAQLGKNPDTYVIKNNTAGFSRRIRVNALSMHVI
jgi:hypothetical protein